MCVCISPRTIVCTPRLDLDKWIYDPPPESEDEVRDDDLGFLMEPSITRGTATDTKASSGKSGKKKKRTKQEKEEEEEMEKVCVFVHSCMRVCECVCVHVENCIQGVNFYLV